jgi:hypothetical protein
MTLDLNDTLGIACRMWSGSGVMVYGPVVWWRGLWPALRLG